MTGLWCVPPVLVGGSMIQVRKETGKAGTGESS